MRSVRTCGNPHIDIVDIISPVIPFQQNRDAVIPLESIPAHPGGDRNAFYISRLYISHIFGYKGGLQDLKGIVIHHVIPFAPLLNLLEISGLRQADLKVVHILVRSPYPEGNAHGLSHISPGRLGSKYIVIVAWLRAVAQSVIRGQSLARKPCRNTYSRHPYGRSRTEEPPACIHPWSLSAIHPRFLPAHVRSRRICLRPHFLRSLPPGRTGRPSLYPRFFHPRSVSFGLHRMPDCCHG